MLKLSTGDRLMSTEEACARYNLSQSGLLAMLDRLQVKRVRIGHKKLISEQAVEAAIARTASAAGDI